ncbi:NAD(P)H-hydrate epimerase [Nonomuraea dietziae]|uniref:NAD(P)H-hydrate epimerase n=1 Tax=Nonomuraea dietziae TaxID=65515 RepID=UPI0031D96B6E
MLVLVGSGDNGGDALHAGAWLARRGARVEALLAAAPSTHEEGLAASPAGGRARRRGHGSWPDLIVDGLVWALGARALREPYASLARQRRTPRRRWSLRRGRDPRRWTRARAASRGRPCGPL